MTKINQIYKCEICGNIVEVVHTGVGQLVCCGQPMKALEENVVDASREKHVPVVEELDGKIKVKIGSEEHPMTEEHYIEWIEVIVGDKVAKKFLKPGMAPEAEFSLSGPEIIVRAYCNLHGLWQKS